MSSKPFTSESLTHPNQVTNMQARPWVYYYNQRVLRPEGRCPKRPEDGHRRQTWPVAFAIDSGAVYRFGGVSQEGLSRLSPHSCPIASPL